MCPEYHAQAVAGLTLRSPLDFATPGDAPRGRWQLWLAVVNRGTGSRVTASDYLGHYQTGCQAQPPKTGTLCVKQY